MKCPDGRPNTAAGCEGESAILGCTASWLFEKVALAMTGITVSLGSISFITSVPTSHKTCATALKQIDVPANGLTERQFMLEAFL